MVREAAKLGEDKLIRSTVGVITNVREDHLDVEARKRGTTLHWVNSTASTCLEN